MKAEDPLVSLESDKATMDVPAPRGGVVKAIAVKVGDKVSEGSVIMQFEGEGGAAAAAPRRAAKPSVSAPPSPVSAPAGVAEVRVPDIGDFKDVPVIEIFVKVGDTVKAEDPLVSLESDKATMDVPAPLSGVVQEIRVKVGDKVSEGSVILALATGAPAPAPPRRQPRRAAAAAGAAARLRRARAAGGHRRSRLRARLRRPGGAQAGARARRRPRQGQGQRRARPHRARRRRGLRQGRRAAAAPAPRRPRRRPPAAASAASTCCPGRRSTSPSSARSSARSCRASRRSRRANLHRNWVVIPHVTTHDEADITELEQFRVQMNKELEKSGVKLSMLPFMMKAAVATLKKFPEFNASLDGDALVLKNYWHIGFAADTPNGLMVPVIRDADKKTVPEIAKEMGELAKLARDGKLKPDQMQGGTFTISSLGGIGGIYFTPIINAPEVVDHGRVQELLEAASPATARPRAGA